MWITDFNNTPRSPDYTCCLSIKKGSKWCTQVLGVFQALSAFFCLPCRDTTRCMFMCVCACVCVCHASGGRLALAGWTIPNDCFCSSHAAAVPAVRLLMKMQLCPLNVIFAHEFLTFIFILSVLQLLDSRSPISQAAAQKMAIITIYIFIFLSSPFSTKKTKGT